MPEGPKVPDLREAGVGARLAVRKFGDALNRLVPYDGPSPEVLEHARRLSKTIRGDYEPGDVIVKDGTKVHRRYVVDDPAFTAWGKLRLRRETGTLMTTWWGSGHNPGWLPKHYRREFPES